MTRRAEEPEWPAKRKLIEVSLPLEAINREAAREKSIRHGHPSTLHLWWARRPLAAARAVLFAQLVDDPSAHPDRFPTEEAQRAERERLHRLIERLVVWENTRDRALFEEARQEILKSTGGNPPPILDPFAGGGTIPLEAQRLGLEAHASDLNPVAVLINKALIEIPPKFADRPPVFPGLAETRMQWEGASGLAADVRAYGEWIRDEAEKRIGHLYPQATLEDGTKANVIAWIWARTVTCPNPACGIEMPLVRSWWLGRKKGKEAWVRPLIVPDPEHPSGKRVEFEIVQGLDGAPTRDNDGTVSRNGAVCVACGASVPLSHVRRMSRAAGLGAKLMAVVAEGRRMRVYLPPTDEHRHAANVEQPQDVPDASLPDAALGFRVQQYGLTRWSTLFTHRQLLALTTFSDLVREARERVVNDARAKGMPTGERLEQGGAGAEAYADAVATYLGFALSRMTDYQSSLTVWSSHPKNELVVHVFGRHAVPMTWDYAEGHPLGDLSGSFQIMVRAIAAALGRLPRARVGTVTQADAMSIVASGVVSTDPPYYDNIGYSDLSDYFYVWLRRSLRDVYPQLLSTMLVPKGAELVANEYRHGGRESAKAFFEGGFSKVFGGMRRSVAAEVPMTVYYAFKQSDSGDRDAASTGWETLLGAMIRSGWAITATWPMRTERPARMLSQRTNALASSIVLTLRARRDDAPTVDRRGFIDELQKQLPGRLRELQQGAIAPVDLPQAAIGPGMAIFSSYAKVLENDGSPMTVRSALARINEVLDQVLNEQEGDFDPSTRFAIAWYRQNGYERGEFGDADNLARARNTTVDAMEREGILIARGGRGRVTLLAPDKLPADYDPLADDRISEWEVLHHLIAILQRDGIPAAGAFLAQVQARPAGEIDPELVKELAFLMFSVAERARRTNDALAFNTVATAWPEIADAARSNARSPGDQQGAFELEEV